MRRGARGLAHAAVAVAGLLVVGGGLAAARAAEPDASGTTTPLGATGHRAPARSVGATARDLWITSAVKMRLLADGRTPGLDVDVDTLGGRVTLFGLVPSAEARTAAVEDARKVAGVRAVDDALQVVPAARRPVVEATDDDVERRVKDALARHAGIDRGVGVAVENGVVRLTGTVPSNDQRLRAAVAARTAPGVRAVRDDLQVGAGE
jgi:osmotically-inducible protein OsmY